MNFLVPLVFTLLILFIITNRKETFCIENRLFRAITKPNNYKKLINNTIGDGCMNKLGKKIIVADMLKNKSYYPKTFSINNINDIPEKRIFSNKIWFIKEAWISGGGSQVFPEIGYDNIKKISIKMLKQFHKGIIIQQNIEPYLINNKKTDIRIFYIMVLYQGKRSFYIQNEGFFKISGFNYNNKSKDKRILVTNTSYKKNKTSKKLISEDVNSKIIIKRLIDIHKDISKVIDNSFDKTYKSKFRIEFQVSGNDFIIDNKLKPYLLELNSGSPSYINDSDSKGTKTLKLNVRNFCNYIIQIGIHGKKLP